MFPCVFFPHKRTWKTGGPEYPYRSATRENRESAVSEDYRAQYQHHAQHDFPDGKEV